jgi:hypothetical protein
MTEKLNVHQRLAKAMEEVDYIQKERKSGMNYTIVSHDAVTAKVRPVLLKNGIVYYPIRCEHSHDGNRAECSMSVRFVNIDEPSDHFDVPTFGYGIDPQDKGPGKAMSYAVKYALLKALGLETGDDPDHDSIPHEPKPKAEPAAKQISAAEQKRQLAEIDRELLDCHSEVTIKACADSWQFIATRDGWSRDYKLAAKAKFDARREAISDPVDTVKEMFPGAQITNERVYSTLEAGE